MVEIKLENDEGESTFSTLSPPVSTGIIEGARDVRTLDNNISTYFTDNKRQWSHTWPYMTEDELADLQAYYDRQFEAFEFPLLTISELGVVDVPVRMVLDTRNLIDNCGTYENITVTWRETIQNPIGV